MPNGSAAVSSVGSEAGADEDGCSEAVPLEDGLELFEQADKTNEANSMIHMDHINVFFICFPPT
ncbi:hypothetical protein D3C79_1006660 [compost metagenome]